MSDDRETDARPAKRARLDDSAAHTPSAAATPAQATPGSALNAPSQIETDYEKEVRAGITEYITPDNLGFTGVLKQRYTDFLVNEIGLDGQVLHLKKVGVEKKKKEAKEAKDAALRKEKGEDDEGGKSRKSAIKSAIKGASIDGDGAKKGKKRKLDGDAEKAPNAKKKKKDEPKQKGAKPKGPVDVERQCGVSLPNGGYCARSLTCKSHSMGLKRAVPGRSLPYDMLLAQYQKKNQAKIQRTYYTVSCCRISCADAFQDLLSTQTRPFRKISSHQALSIRTKKKIL